MGLHWLLARVSPVWAGGLLLMGIGSRGPITHIYDIPVGRRRVRCPPNPPGSLFNHVRPVHIGTPRDLIVILHETRLFAALTGDIENSQLVIRAVEPGKEYGD